MNKVQNRGIAKPVIVVIAGLLLVVVAMVVFVVLSRGKAGNKASRETAGSSDATSSQSQSPAGGAPAERRDIEGLNVKRQLTEEEVKEYGFLDGSVVFATPKLDDVGTLYMDFDVQSSPSDADGDRLTDEEEAKFGSDPNKYDTDDDGLDDMSEMTLGTNPRKADTDGDGYSDGEEIQMKRDPNNASR